MRCVTNSIKTLNNKGNDDEVIRELIGKLLGDNEAVSQWLEHEVLEEAEHAVGEAGDAGGFPDFFDLGVHEGDDVLESTAQVRDDGRLTACRWRFRGD